MTLEERINADIKTAMLAKDSKKLEAIRSVKSAILLLKSSTEGHTIESETKALQKMVKQRKETADVYTSQNRSDLAEVELFQSEIIESYLPEAMSDVEIRTNIHQVIIESGETNLGKIMGLFNKAYMGKGKTFDNKVVSQLIKEELA